MATHNTTRSNVLQGGRDNKEMNACVLIIDYNNTSIHTRAGLRLQHELNAH